MRRIVLPAVFWVVAVLALVVGIGLIALGQWTRPLLEASQAVAEADRTTALQQFADSEARFVKVPVAKQLAPGAYDASVANQLALLYRMERYDELLEKAATSPALPATHYWAGCALFIKARAEEQPDARIGWLSRAEQEFRNALQLAPDDWDTKYNYELTRRLLAELRKQPKTPPKQLLQLLRPQPKATGEPVKRVG